MSTPQYPSDRPEQPPSTESGAPARRPQQPESADNFPTQQYRSQPQHPTEPQFSNSSTVESPPSTATGAVTPPVRRDVVAREKEEFGGVKIGTAFFGWLTTVGALVVTSGLAAVIITVLGTNGVNTSIDAGNGAAGQIENNVNAMGFDGILGAVIAAVIIFVSFYCGGYVAGRMARFDGIKQGVAVWVWAIAISIVLAILAAVGSTQLGSILPSNAVPQMSMDGDSIVSALITLGITLIVSLGGAIIGGLAGMRFHRKVDKAGLGH